MWPKNVLMVTPDYFEVQYEINPHMSDKEGNLAVVDPGKAMGQWLILKSVFEDFGLKVSEIYGVEDLPDMVFCANQMFPFVKDGVKSVILSNMMSDFRKPEVDHFKIWAQKQNIKTYTIETQPFEGMGDLLWNYESGELYGGYGFRTKLSAYDEIQKIIDRPVVPLKLIDPRFYHLDTCLSILSLHKAAYVPEAFDEETREKLQSEFRTLIPIPIEEAETLFAGNGFTPNGKDVILQKGATTTTERLEAEGFRVTAVNTSEFIKAGGSVFCMKFMYF